jgi:hypothetical protein
MIMNVEDEDLVVRWTFAEIMSYLRRTHRPYWFKYHPGHMKVHKIMYQTFESTEVPVTRSWYRYGCFIHSNQLAGFRDFSALKNRYLRGVPTHPRLESAVARMGFDVNSIRKVLHETIDNMPQRMSIFVRALYQDAPEKFGNIYMAKLELHNILRRSAKIDFQNLSKFQSWLSKVRRNISIFHMAAFSREQFSDLAEIVMNFTTNIEEALLKTEKLIINGERVPKKKIKLIHNFSTFFDEYVWLIFALEISAQTVKGFRSQQIRAQQRQKKQDKMIESLDALKTQSATLAANNLTLSWYDYRDVLSRSASRNAIEKALSKMKKTYNGSLGSA